MDDLQIKSDKAAYNILKRYDEGLVDAIDTLLGGADDFEEREILVGLIAGAARYVADKLTPKAAEKSAGK